MYKIAKENLTALFQKIASEQELYLPVKTAGQTNFGVWTEDAEVDLDTLKTVKSPKDVFSRRARHSIPVLRTERRSALNRRRSKSRISSYSE